MIVKITKVNPLREDKRGLAYGFTLRKSKYFVVLNRKKGTVSGRHYHKGLTKSKSPELFYLAKGKIKLVVKSIPFGKSEEHQSIKSGKDEEYQSTKSGEIEVHKSINPGNSKEHHEEHRIEEHYIQENNIIEIPAMVYHEVHALTDIILIEFDVEESDFRDETVNIHKM